MALDAAYLKRRFLQGVPLEDASGKPFASENFDDALREAKAFFTRKFGVLFEPTHVVLGNVPPKAQPQSGAIISSNGIDYDPQTWHADRWASIQLPYGPVKGIDYVGLGLGGQALPTIIEFPHDWWQLSERRYFLRLYPGYLSLQTFAASSFHLSIVASKRRIPNAWRIVYRAGFEDVFADEPDLAHAVGLKAVISLLPALAMLQSGSNTSESVSVDGLSQSRSYPVSATSHKLSPLQSSLEAELDAFLSMYFAAQRGPRIFSV
jgi:hypothetical protein